MLAYLQSWKMLGPNAVCSLLVNNYPKYGEKYLWGWRMGKETGFLRCLVLTFCLFVGTAGSGIPGKIRLGVSKRKSE